MNELRNRAWRRFKNRINSGRGIGTDDCWKPEKNWKMVYLRSEKLSRARQLGFEYPRKDIRQLLDIELINGE
ncbi:hypothetical protein [Spartinivicinus poritis]|uniref:Uncharacterized protein n=1 Tax=Spartinivicinus poritis TaxID=2994640 RepID=A0ABT5UIF4_9GAMM|nr:hypothetical protein [Spartinivicinus sp. A2-2]MDE1464834.1 hypothetical protein [Spartinivicinus sp. A2-2]